MAYLHSMNIIHRDLKPSNILVESAACRVVKISDFGKSRVLNDTSIYYGGEAGDRRFMPPEALTTNPVFSKPSDVYSFGMVLWCLVSGKLSELYLGNLPFGDLEVGKHDQFILDGNRPPIPDAPALTAAIAIMESCWVEVTLALRL